MSPLTAVSVLLAVIVFVEPRLAPLGLALAGATPMAAAYVIGTDTAIPTFGAVAIGAIGRFVLDALGRRNAGGSLRPVPGLLALWCFLLVAAAVTLIAPFLFRNAEVLLPTGKLRPLGGPESLGISSFAQFGYLLIGVLTVALIARSRTAGPWMVGLTLGIITLLSAWRLLYLDYGVPFPEGLFDGSPAFGYVDGAPGGIRRFRGILAEPALLGTLSVATAAYAIARLPRARIRGRVGWAFILVVAGINGFNALSTTFVISALVVIGASVVVLIAKVVEGRARGLGTAVGVVLILGVGWFAAPVVSSFASQSVSEKVSSTSYDQRSSFDNHSWDLLQLTHGFGVGLGVNRASSFAANLAAATGVLGVALFAAAVLLIFRASLVSRAAAPVRWALFALLVSKALSSPDLGDTSGLLWTCLGVLALSALRTPPHLPSRQGRSSLAIDPAVDELAGSAALVHLTSRSVKSGRAPFGSAEPR